MTSAPTCTHRLSTECRSGAQLTWTRPDVHPACSGPPVASAPDGTDAPLGDGDADDGVGGFDVVADPDGLGFAVVPV